MLGSTRLNIILEPLLFLLYANDLHNSSEIYPIMFAVKTHFFYEHRDLETLSSLINQEQQKINEWFEAKKFSLNIGKTKYSIFHKPSIKDDLPLLLTTLLIKKHRLMFCKMILERSY